ncbi:permease [Serratia sp. Leaf50]|nr:permease [Serratia sp. Leaf50]
MTIFLPLGYLLVGWLIGQTSWDIKTLASTLLTRLFIPLVIVFNIATHFSSMSGIIIATALAMLILLGVSRLFTRDPVLNLCFCYLNIGWLGLPVATALFGNEAAVIIIAAYVGSSIMGNSVGAGMLSGNAFNLKKLIQTPPVIALAIGILLIPFSREVKSLGVEIYPFAKFMMSFLGMAILGIWLSKVKVRAVDFRRELKPFLLRSAVMAILVTLMWMFARYIHQTTVVNNAPTLYLLCLLPPAANIIVLETHYLGSGRSARPISCGTCISIVAIALYAGAITLSH